MRAVGRTFANRSPRRRVIALAAAYAIALSSLVASFSTARAAADVAALPGGVICHGVAGQGAPSDQTNDKTSDNKTCSVCCTGCLMTMAALPPSPADSVAVSLSATEIVHLPTIAVVAGAPETKSHCPRAPPYGA